MAQGSNAVLGRATRVAEESAIVALFAPLALLCSPRLRRVLLAAAILDIPLDIGTHLGWREVDGTLGALAGMEISITTIALAGLYLSVLLERSAQTQARERLVWTSAPLLIWFGFAVLSVGVAHDKQLAFFDVWQMSHSLLLFLFLVNWTRNRERVLFIVKWLAIGFIIEIAVFFMLATIGSGISLPGLKLRVDVGRGFGSALSSTRLGGTLGSPNGAGAYLAFLIPTVFSVAFTDLPRRFRRLCVIASALGMIALVLTYSRGSWIGFAASILFLFALAFRGRPAKSIAAVLVTLVLGIVLLGTDNIISNRVFGEDHGAAYGRVPLMRLAGRMIVDNPVLGIGDNNFTIRIDDYIDRFTRSEWLYVVHNYYLLVWSEIGTFGFLAFLWFLVQTFRRGWRCWKAHDAVLSPLALGLTAAFLSHAVHMSMDTFRGRTLLNLMIISAAIFSASLRMIREEQLEKVRKKAAVA